MAEEELTVVKIHEEFYRDHFRQVVLVMSLAALAIILVIATSVYLFISKPPPVTFGVAKEWRVQAPVPIDQPYLADSDVLQWVANTIPKSFDFNFLHLDEQLEDLKQYYTDNGYEIFLAQLKNRFEKQDVMKFKLFLRAEPTAAPSILNQGILSGRYAWWVQIPIKISYAGMRVKPEVKMVLQVLVVRTETTNNLTGILIDNVIAETNTNSRVTGT